MKKNLIILVGLSIFLSCSSVNKTTDPVFLPEKLTDVKYGQYDRNIMDVYLPAKRSVNSPFVLLIHGGAWTMAGKENIRDVQDTLFNNGIASASINHRYANDGDVHYPQMLADIDAALNYCIANSKKWGIRKKGFTMMGVSSGGHLALLYAYTTTKKIDDIVEFCGPNNFTDTSLLQETIKNGLIKVINKMTGHTYIVGGPPDNSYYQSSPYYFVKNLPILIVHGNADVVVPYKQSVQLNKKLDSLGITHRLITVEGANHDLNFKDTAIKTMVYSAVVEWINKYGK